LSDYDQFQAMNTEAVRTASSADPRSPVLPCESHWLEIECYYENGSPAAGRRFTLRRASGAPLLPGVLQINGTLDRKGYARIVRIEGAEECVLELPETGGSDPVPMYEGFWPEVEARHRPASGG
jgi:hypothetical protein